MAPDRCVLAVLGSVRGGARALYLVDLATGRSRLARRFEDDASPQNPAWSPDGRRIAVELLKSISDLFICDLDGSKPVAVR